MLKRIIQVSQKYCSHTEYLSVNGKSAYEKQTGRESNIIKKLIITNPWYISEPQSILLTEKDVESGQDSTILVRERTRDTKLEGAFKKRKDVLLEQSNDPNHTFTFLPAGENQPTIISKRDIGNTDETTDKPCCSKEAT